MSKGETSQDWPLLLVVDDDANTRLLTRTALEPHGFRVAEAPDGATALALCQKVLPDLVLLDVMMPGMDGYQTCAALRRLPGAEDLAIVMMTGLEDLESISRAFQAGVTDFVTKPLNWILLRYRVQYILMASRALRQQRFLTEQLHHSQKMEALGRLAGGVAHDFNNLLTVITGCTDLLLSRLPKDDACRGDLEEIREAAEQAMSLTQQLLAFSRRQVLRPQVVDLKLLVAQMERLLRRIIGEDIEVMTVYPEEDTAVLADRGQLEQVIMNLAVNARDAMPQGGRLTLEINRVTLDEEFCRWQPEAHPGAFVKLTVKDTGVGMDEAVMARVFEPFFTTKGPGLGTGLGLSMVHGIVKQSGGFIQVKSHPGKGTTFDIYLPLTSKEPQPVALPPPPVQPLQGEETILLVEDDILVRRVAGKILRTQGYRVLEAGSGFEALEVGRQHSHPIDLIFTDLVMPDMNGLELTDRWQHLHPESRVLFTSGYGENSLLPTGSSASQVPFIAKPYRLQTLAQKVREILTAKSDQ
jgi:two-component system cell cycle sensor histidine kinase/response regulator CckA